MRPRPVIVVAPLSDAAEKVGSVRLEQFEVILRKGLKEVLFGRRQGARRPVNIMDIKKEMRESFLRQRRENPCRAGGL